MATNFAVAFSSFRSRYTEPVLIIETVMKTIVLVLLAAIVIALFSGLYFLVRDKDHPNSPRLLTALKVRVGLSILLVLLLVASYRLGWLAT